jgi:multidrug resistance efflux pump
MCHHVAVVSPKSGFVASAIADRTRVQPGTIVLTLDSSEEDLKIARLTALEEARQAMELRLSPQVQNINRQIAQAAIDMSNALLNITNDQILAEVTGANIGLVFSVPDYLSSLVNNFTLGTQSGQAVLQKQQLETRITEAQAINSLVKNHLQTEMVAAQAAKAQTVVKALVSGQIHLAVPILAFVKKGELLFNIS